MKRNNFFCKILFLILMLNFYFIKVNRKTNNEKNHISILRKTSAECTLFLNKNDEFPIKNPCKVLLIGSGARNTIIGGFGSSNVESINYTTCEEGLEKAEFKITTKEWLNQYIKIKEGKIKEYIENIKKSKKYSNYVIFPEYEYNLNIKEKKYKADIVIYVLSRNSGESIDRKLIKGDFFLTDTEIKDILYLDKKYKKFMLYYYYHN